MYIWTGRLRCCQTSLWETNAVNAYRNLLVREKLQILTVNKVFILSYNFLSKVWRKLWAMEIKLHTSTAVVFPCTRCTINMGKLFNMCNRNTQKKSMKLSNGGKQSLHKIMKDDDLTLFFRWTKVLVHAHPRVCFKHSPQPQHILTTYFPCWCTQGQALKEITRDSSHGGPCDSPHDTMLVLSAHGKSITPCKLRLHRLILSHWLNQAVGGG